ncbi:YtxH domain-containing protein [Patescibacteria group bacterium]|nr:YtxH domain-containing protein [Patescibacteria group bacterium]
MKKKESELADGQKGPNGFALGVLMGAGLVFLFGTKEGRKIKDQLAKKGKEVAGDLPDFVDKLQDEGKKLAHRSKEVKEKLEQKAQELAPEVSKKTQIALEHIEETQQRGRKAAKAVNKRFFTRKGKKLS